MKISSKKEFNSLVTSIKSTLSKDGHLIKTTRMRELFAKSLGCKSANGLLATFPTDIKITTRMGGDLSNLLKELHDIENVDGLSLLTHLEREHISYSTYWKSDSNCYPKSKSPNEEYWYLTKNGWLSWGDIDFNRMKVELNIFKVVRSSAYYLSDSEGGFGSVSSRPIWDASVASYEFEVEAEKLEQQYGDMPNSDALLKKVSREA